MAQHVQCDRLDVFRRHVVFVPQPGVCAGAAIERDGRARAGAELDHGRKPLVVARYVAAGQHQLHDVFLDRFAHVDGQHLAAGGEDLLPAHLDQPRRLALSEPPAAC